MISTRSAWPACAVVAAVGAGVLLAGCDEDYIVAPSAWLEVSTATTGGALDADGYTLLVDGSPAARKLDLTDTLRFAPTTTRTVELELTDVAGNCAVTGGAHRTLTLVPNGSVGEAFDVACEAPPALASIRLIHVRDGEYPASDLYEMRADGTGERAITTDGRSFDPTVSAADGRIAYVRLTSETLDFVDSWNTEVRVLAPGGLDDAPLTDEDFVSSPSWSPDGSRLAYSFGDGWWSGEIRIRSLDGAGPVIFPTPGADYEPAWAPDGSRIAFVRWSDGDLGLYTMRPDGSDIVRVARGGRAPVWSPSADRIAYQDRSHIALVDLAGGEPVRLLSGGGDTTWEPTGWSADGDWIVLDRIRPSGSDIFLLHVDDGTLLRVTADGVSHSGVAVPVS